MIVFPAPVLRLVLPAVLILAVAGCSGDRFGTMRPPPPAAPPPVESAAAPAAPPAPAADPAATHAEVVRPGTARLVAPLRRPAAVEPADLGPVTLNFVAVDVHDFARAVLGDVLGLEYVVDAVVQGTVTVETPRPVPRAEVLPAVEAGLRASGLALIRRGEMLAIVPLAEARRQAGAGAGGDPGFASEVVPLRYVAAAQLKKLFEPMVPDGAIQADPARNVLVITGSGGERQSLRAMIGQFDVNWMRGMSFALITLDHVDCRKMVEDLNQLVNAEGSPAAGLVRMVPVSQRNAIIVISTQPSYIDDIRFWATELDREGEGRDRRLHIYRVQNGRAVNLAAVLTNVFAGATPAQIAGGTGSTAPQATGAALESRVSGLAASLGSTQRSATATTVMAAPGAGGAGPAGGGAGAVQPGQQPQQLRLGETGQPISITCDETNNAIVVYATRSEYEIIESALRQLDVLPLQVMIEAVITEVTLNDALRYGVEWYFKAGGSHFTLTSGSTNQPHQTFPGFSYLLSRGDGIQAVINALDDVTRVNVVSSPQLLVLNNQTAALQVGDQVPVATQSSVSTTTANAAIVNSIEYRDTGVILKVTPRVNASGLVLLDIAQEVSDVTTTTSSELDSPTIQQRRISSSVAVQDGQTVALGGLIRDNLKREDSGVPLLKDIPVLGMLFSSASNNRGRTELLVMLTPRVVRSPVDARALSDELRRKIGMVEPIPPARDPGR